MPINFDDTTIEQLEREFLGFPAERQAKLDSLAAMVFVNLHMVGLAHVDLPSTVPQLKSRETAKLRLLASTLEAVFGMTASYTGKPT